MSSPRVIGRRAVVSGLAIAAVTGPWEVRAQPARVPRVGILTPGHSTESPSVQREPFERGLRELGWTPGSTILLEYRYAEGRADRLAELAADLVRLKVDVIVARSAVAIRAAQRATDVVAIVMSSGADPVADGLVKSLARPGGNITGIANLVQELEGKRLELLKEAVPGVARVAILGNPGNSPGTRLPAASRALGLETQTFVAHRADDLAETFAAMSRARVGAVLVWADTLVLEPNRARVTELAARHRVPAMYPWRFYVDAGGLMSYATSIPAFHHRSATYVDRILKGVRPGDLPIEQPTKFELVINLKTAKALGLTIPQSVVLRADELVE
jgi:putative tryptophan/tyrosine transport system substrate-binding protein